MPTLIAMAAIGRAVRRVAAAAGLMTRVRTRSTPTTCTASAVVSATSRRSITDRSRSDTPRASAASGSTLANNSGQNVRARTASANTATAARTQTCRSFTPTMLPNKRPVAIVA